nr:transcription termination/antitermination NusG family protein [Desulfobacter curvatus]
MKIINGACSGQLPGEDTPFFTDFENWYAIQTMSGCEKRLIATLQVLLKRIQLYLPARKVIHQIKGEQNIIELPLFPGYIFVYKSISESLDALEKANSMIAFNPVMANGKFLEANKNEMRFLFEVTGGDGVIELSKGIVMENEEVLIIEGPLRQLKGRILFIDKRKNKAKVRIKFMNRLLDVSLGLEILSRPLPKVQ